MRAKQSINPEKTKLTRLPVPVISSHNMRVGTEDQIKRSWPVTPDDFFRIYRDEPFSLEMEFLEDIPSAKVRLYTNLLSAAGEWEEIEFTPATSQRFVLSVSAVKCGIFLFKEKYSLNNGET